MGKKDTDRLIAAYIDAARFQLFKGEIREMFPRIKRLDLRLYAFKRYVFAMNDPERGMAWIKDKWVWSDADVEEYEQTEAHSEQSAAIERAKKKFNAENPGFRLKAGKQHRDLSAQLWGWNHNGGAKSKAEKFLDKTRKEIRRKQSGDRKYPDLGHRVSEVSGQHLFQVGAGGELREKVAEHILFGGDPGAAAAAAESFYREEFEGLLRFIDYLKKPFWASGTVTVATPGLSDHGTGRAIDFRVHDAKTGKKLHGAGGPDAWRSSGFAKALKKAMSVSPNFHGPLKSPDEPWHYHYSRGDEDSHHH